MIRHRLLLAVTWSVVTVAAVCIAWLAVSHAVANVADPTPAMIRGQRASSADATAAAALTTVTTEIVSQALPASTANATSSSQSEPAAQQPSSASTASAVGDPFAVARDDAGATGSPSATTASFNTAGGVVTMRCEGAMVSLVSATPNQGYTVAVSNSGPNEIEVTFKSSSQEVEFHGRCVEGQPAAEISDD